MIYSNCQGSLQKSEKRVRDCFSGFSLYAELLAWETQDKISTARDDGSFGCEFRVNIPYLMPRLVRRLPKDLQVLIKHSTHFFLGLYGRIR